MPTNLIQIKRSTTTSEPPTLSPGELAYSQASNTFWIGLPTPVNEGGGVTKYNVRIGGAMYPGTLTPSQALVANSTGGINRVVAANVELGRLSANGSWGNPGYVLTSAGSSDNAYWQAVSAIGVNPNAQYVWTNTQIFTNTVSFTKETGVNIQAYNINVATSFTVSNGYAGAGSGGVTIAANSIGIGNGSIKAEITANSTAVMFTGTAWNTDRFNGLLPSSYVNVNSLNTTLTGYGTTTSVTQNAATAYTNAVAYTDDRIGVIPSSLRVNTAILGYSDNAYANAVTLINSKIGTANTAMVANAAAAYSNALLRVSEIYVNTQNFSANLVNYASLTGALFTGSVNAVSHTSGIYGTPTGGVTVNSVAVSVGNSSVNGAISTNATVAYFTGTAYNANNANNAAYLGGLPSSSWATIEFVNNAVYGATGGSASQDYVNEKTANAYANAVAYTDSKISTANAAITGNAATAFANAVANSANYIDSKIATANAAIVANAAAAYTNANFYTGVVVTQAKSDVKADIFANNNTFNGRNTFSANVTFTDDIFVSGVQTIDAAQSNLNILNVSVAGNLTVLGTLTTIDTENIRIEDASLQLASNQAATSTFNDNYDISVFGTFGNTSNTWYTGIYRDHFTSQSHYTKNVWKLYAANNVYNYETTGSSTVLSGVLPNAPGANYKLGTLTAYLEPYEAGGAFVVNSSSVTINSAALSSSSYSVRITANTLSLVTPLAATSGGTGLNLYNTGDILYASSSTTLAKRTIGSVGKVLQVNSSNLPEWDNLDGGTF